MTQHISIDGQTYPVSDLTDQGRATLARLATIDARMTELNNLRAVFTRAKRSYIEELKHEMIKGRTGLDLSTLFSD